MTLNPKMTTTVRDLRKVDYLNKKITKLTWIGTAIIGTKGYKISLNITYPESGFQTTLATKRFEKNITQKSLI